MKVDAVGVAARRVRAVAYRERTRLHELIEVHVLRHAVQRDTLGITLRSHNLACRGDGFEFDVDLAVELRGIILSIPVLTFVGVERGAAVAVNENRPAGVSKAHGGTSKLPPILSASSSNRPRATYFFGFEQVQPKLTSPTRFTVCLPQLAQRTTRSCSPGRAPWSSSTSS